jgi:hypothetical protein
LGHAAIATASCQERPLVDDDYRRGDEILSAMDAGETPGERTSITKYDVAVRVTP